MHMHLSETTIHTLSAVEIYLSFCLLIVVACLLIETFTINTFAMSQKTLSRQARLARITEVDQEIRAIRQMKKDSPLTLGDVENTTENYQMHLEWNYALEELLDERKLLVTGKAVLV